MVNWRILVFIVVVGVGASLVSGVVENNLDHISTPVEGHAHYGFPFVWRSADPFVGESYYYLNLLADCVFWVMIASITALLLKFVMKRGAKTS